MPDSKSLNAYAENYAGLEGRDLISTVLRDFPGRSALLSSFGAESSVLLHMVSELDRSLPVIFLDTEKLFPETLVYRDQLVSEFGLTNVQISVPDPLDLARIDPDGALHKKDTDLCCHVRKTVPLEKAFHGFDVMISGRKRFHGSERAGLNYVGIDSNRLKVEPLAGYSALDLHSYMQRHHLPSHPLRLAGFRSIGCMPCTVAGGTDENPRAGRWSESDKTECGIHFSANGQVIRTVARLTAQV